MRRNCGCFGGCEERRKKEGLVRGNVDGVYIYIYKVVDDIVEYTIRSC